MARIMEKLHLKEASTDNNLTKEQKKALKKREKYAEKYEPMQPGVGRAVAVPTAANAAVVPAVGGVGYAPSTIPIAGAAPAMVAVTAPIVSSQTVPSARPSQSFAGAPVTLVEAPAVAVDTVPYGRTILIPQATATTTSVNSDFNRREHDVVAREESLNFRERDLARREHLQLSREASWEEDREVKAASFITMNAQPAFSARALPEDFSGVRAATTISALGTIPVSADLRVNTSVPISGEVDINASIPIEGEFPLRTTLPVTGMIRIRSMLPADGVMPIRGSIPVNGHIPVAGRVPVCGTLPLEGIIPINGQIPLSGNIPVQTAVGVAGNIGVHGTSDGHLNAHQGTAYVTKAVSNTHLEECGACHQLHTVVGSKSFQSNSF